MIKHLIPLFSLHQIYNLYFLIVVKKTFNACLKDHTLTLADIESDLAKQRTIQKRLCSEILNLAAIYPEFSGRNLWDEAGLQNVEDPITKDFYRSVNNWSTRQGLWKKSANTSGSSGVSLKIERSPSAFLNSQISFFRFFVQFGISRFDRNIYVGGARKSEVSIFRKIKTWCFSKIIGMHKFVATDMVSEEHFINFIRVYEKVKPIYLQGFSSALLRIANYIDKENIELKWSPSLIHPSAEGMSVSQREILERVFKCPVAMVYGSAECHMASECAYGTMHLNMRSCDLKTNNDGTAILTAFETEVMPIVNYQMGDILELEDPHSPCACGKHTTIITKIIGRVNDKIILPSGRVLTHPDLNMLIEQIDVSKAIKEYQIIHYSGTDQVEIRYVAKLSFDDSVFLRLLNQRFCDVEFIGSSAPFNLLPNGKKPVIMTVNESPHLRSTYDEYKPYSEISDSQNSNNIDGLLKLDWNESTMDFPPALKAKAFTELAKVPLNNYPDLQASRLKEALGKWLKIDPKCVTVFNGSDAGIATICRLFVEDTDTVVTVEPTYGNYKAIASQYTKNIKSYQLDYPFTMNLDSFYEYLEKETPKLVFFTNPNNPTGVEFQRESIFELASNFARTCFVVDEAYVEFGNNSLMLDLIPENVIILRTFSKAFGLAGVRLGYSLASEALAIKIGYSKDNKEVDVFAQIIGSIAVSNPGYMFDYVDSIKQGREVLLKFFDQHKIQYLAGMGNFVLFKVKNPFEVERCLKDQNIFIRNRTEVKNLEGYLRVTLGDQALMTQFTIALEKLL